MLSLLLFNIVLEVLVSAVRQEKEIKSILIGKKEIKLSLFTDDMIVYTENLKELTKKKKKKLQELISNYSKLARYKVNTQKSIAFQFEVKNTQPFTLLRYKSNKIWIRSI